MPVQYIFILLLLIILLLFIFTVNTHLKSIRLKVLHTPDSKKLEHLNGLLLPYGFQYDISADCFYSTIHCWQRKYGYRRLYDGSAAALGMIFDCEPIYFDYDGRHWLIEFWKGQYGMSAGTEVGIYAADEHHSQPSVPRKMHYKSIRDSELFPVRISLFHGEKLIAIREMRHWWLTAFFLGKYCPPHTLAANISITFPDYEMCNAYINGLKRAGYASTDISRCLLTVTVPFTQPKSEQPAAQHSAFSKLRLCLNHFCCRLYLGFTGKYTNTLDRLEYLASLNPVLLNIALHFTRTQKRYNRYHSSKETPYVHRKPFE